MQRLKLDVKPSDLILEENVRDVLKGKNRTLCDARYSGRENNTDKISEEHVGDLVGHLQP